jgi:uncharacterized protein (TIGR03067 family)
MHQTASVPYLDSESCQVVELRYAGREMSLLVFLPKKPDGLADLESSLTADTLATSVAKLQPSGVDLAFPKFQLAAELELRDTLRAMGMTLAFEPHADFSQLCSAAESPKLSAVLQKAVIDVNEEGSEASAATAIKAARSILNPERPAFRADHPFLFLIRHNPTGSILFLGRITEPPAATLPRVAEKRASRSVRGPQEPSDQQKLQGSWVLVSAEDDGKPKPKKLVKTGSLVVRGDTFTLKMGQTTYTGVEKLDESKLPKEIDVTFNDGPQKGGLQRGIYELDGDQHRTCIALPGKERPTAFTGSSGGSRLRTWMRGER